MSRTKIIVIVLIITIVLNIILGTFNYNSHKTITIKDDKIDCPYGFVRWRGNCIAETVIVFTPDCPEGYAITEMSDNINCTAGLWVNIKGDTFR